MGNCSSSSCGSHGQQDKSNEEQEKQLKKSLNKIKNKFVIMSGKGGVGKTSVTVNLGIALAKKGFNVGIIDVDIHGPDVPRMLGLSSEQIGIDENKKLQPIKYSDNLKIVSIESLSQNKDDAIIWRGPLKFAAIRQFISEVQWGNLDFLLIDSPPGTGDEPLTVAQTIPDAKAIIVTTPQEIALADVRKSISFCKTVNMEIFGLIENMSGYICPKCGEILDLFGKGGGQKTANQFEINFLGEIAFDKNLVLAGDKGKSYQDEFSDSPVSKSFDNVATLMSKLIKE